MGLTVTKEPGQNTNYSQQSDLARGLKVQFGKFTPDNSWLAVGEALTFGFTPIKVDIESTGGIVFSYDYGNGKVLAWYCDLSSATDAALIVVPDAVDLSTICADTRFTAYGWL